MYQDVKFSFYFEKLLLSFLYQVQMNVINRINEKNRFQIEEVIEHVFHMDNILDFHFDQLYVDISNIVQSMTKY
jgi:hypothetical protein